MRRVEAGGTWSLFDPAACPGLNECWGDEYAALYERYEAEGLAVRSMPAQDLWFEILRSQIETGTPYVLFKDAANAKSNQQNLGCIKTSNLCRCGGGPPAPPPLAPLGRGPASSASTGGGAGRAAASAPRTTCRWGP